MAQVVIEDISDLTRIFEVRVSKALKATQDEIYKVIQKHISDYYHEKVFRHRNGGMSEIPEVYKRTYQFLNSLIKTNIVSDGNSFGCSVKIDMESLNYLQPAEVVIDMIYRGYHADTGLNDGNYETPYDIHTLGNFWEDSIEELGGEVGITNLMKQNLIKCGVPVV